MTSTFDYLKPLEEDLPRIEFVRQAFRTLETSLADADVLVPGRCTSLHKTKLEEACMWAIKGIVHKQYGLS